MEVHFVVTYFLFISMSLNFSCKWPWRLNTPCFRHLLRLLIFESRFNFIYLFINLFLLATKALLHVSNVLHSSLSLCVGVRN